MADIVIGAMIALIAAVAAVFLILLGINIALVVKLRSIIPPPPYAGPPTVPPAAPAPASKNARR